AGQPVAQQLGRRGGGRTAEQVRVDAQRVHVRCHGRCPRGCRGIGSLRQGTLYRRRSASENRKSKMSPWTLTARWVFPVDGPPLERGTVTIDGAQIAAVEPHGRRAADVDLGDTAVLPGLVNAHTHLDLSGLRALALTSPDFTG